MTSGAVDARDAAARLRRLFEGRPIPLRASALLGRRRSLALALALAAWALLADERRGFVAALLAGLLITPFTFLYMVSIRLVGVRPAPADAGRATRLQALAANPGTLGLSTAWGITALAVVAAWPAARPPSARLAAGRCG